MHSPTTEGECVLRLKLFEVARNDPDQQTDMIAARSPDHAAAIYVTHELANDREVNGFTIERVDQTLTGDQRVGLDDMLGHGVAGMVIIDPMFGWVVSQPV
jgi:hypothetical protein